MYFPSKLQLLRWAVPVTLVSVSHCNFVVPDGSGKVEPSTEGFTPLGSGGSSSSTGGSSSGTRTGWAIGSYFAPEYVNGTGPDQPPMVIAFAADGTWSHTTSGKIDKSGKWDYAGRELALDGSTLTRSKNCAIITYDSRKYYRDTTITGCPDTVATLTSVEKCLLGEFEERRDLNTTVEVFNHKRNTNRLEVFEQIYSGAQDSHYTEVYTWHVTGDQLCYDESGCQAINWADVEKFRKSVKDSGCVLPAGASTAYCNDYAGVTSSGVGCQTYNNSGPAKYLLDCRDTGGCSCKKGTATVWTGHTGNSNSCGGTTQLWKDCCAH